MSDTIRVRYAPSPTGLQHVGNIRTALFDWLFARRQGGKFVLRIEDTDRERSKPEYVTQILEDFRWLGMDWDEGPEVGGPYGPYVQSERLEIYREYAQRLMDEGKAYRCYCSTEELEARRQKATETGGVVGYDNRCRELSEAQRKEKEAAGAPYSVRFRVPNDKVITFEDLVLGTTSFESRLISDFVIMKSDGWPTYHFSVVVDDALMKITHVIRAEGHLSNTPLHVMLFEGLDFARPEFAHLPSVLSPDGKGKLSKRHGALSLVEYRKQGYLPEALVNFMALLGWSPGNDQEFMTREEMVGMFELGRVKKTGARFDMDKLLWMNSAYIKKASSERLAELAREAFKEAGTDASGLSGEQLTELVEVYREKLKLMSELPVMARFLFVDEVEYVEKDVKDILLKGDGIAKLRQAHEALGALAGWEKEALQKALGKLATDAQVGFGKVAQPIRVALTGSKVSPGIGETLHLIGRERSLRRMERTLAKFGGGQ